MPKDGIAAAKQQQSFSQPIETSTSTARLCTIPASYPPNYQPEAKLKAWLHILRIINQKPNSKPAVASLDGEQRHFRGGNSQKPLVIATASPEARCKREDSPLDFSAHPTPPRERKSSSQDKAKAAEVKKKAKASTTITKAQ